MIPSLYHFTSGFLLGLFGASLWIVPLIGLLYKMHFTALHKVNSDKKNKKWVELNAKKNGTPTLGGIIIWITSTVLWWLVLPHTKFNLTIIAAFFIIGLFGFIEGIFDMVTKYNDKLRILHDNFYFRIGKLTLMYLVHVGIAVMIVRFAGIKSVEFLGHKFNFNLLWIPILGFISVASSYATDLIDGMDALATSLFIVNILGFLLMLVAGGASVHTGIYVLLGIVLGSLIVYLYFNIPPARVFMGGPGALPMGTLFFIIALKYNLLVFFFVSMLLYYIDTATSFIQIISMKFFNKRIFKIAPFHHHFHALGWPEHKVVMRFILFHLVFVLIAIFLQVYV